MFKMLNMTNMIILIIAVTALIISIICMNKKCDNFGDYVCPDQRGAAKKGEECIIKGETYGDCNPSFACAENLTCDEGKCRDLKEGESEKQICKGVKYPDPPHAPVCTGSGPTPTKCSLIKKGERGNIICDSSDCKGCKKYKGCRVFTTDDETRSICGNIVESNPGPGENTLQQACMSNENPWSLDCSSKNFQEDPDLADQVCQEVCDDKNYKCKDGKCTISLFENVNM